MDALSEDLRLFITNGGCSSRLDVGGEIDFASAGVLGDRLTMLVESGNGDVEVDMSQVDFCDSTGLCALITARQQLHDRGRRLRIVNPSTAVTRLFELAGLSSFLAESDGAD